MENLYYWRSTQHFRFNLYRKFGFGLILLLTIGFTACQSRISGGKSNQEGVTTEVPAKYEVARQFINAYADYSNDRSAETGILDWVNAQDNVSEDFKAELERIITEAERQNPDLGLEFDPIFEAQDFPDSFEIASYEGDFVTVMGREFPNFKLTMKVVEENKRWLVDGSGIVNIPEEKRVKRF